MKTLVVICAMVACCVATPGWSYSTWDAGVYGANIVSPGLWAGSPLVATRTVSLAHPSIVAAPTLLTTKTLAAAPAIIAPAPVVAAPAPVVAAPAPVVAAPAVIATKTVVAPAPAVLTAPAPAVLAAPAVTKTQYHSQDELGQATYGHSEPLQAHNAVQDAHGNKVGSFSYLNPHDGQIHRTDYVADALGYRVAANDLPIDTPEVALAKAAHITAHAAARSRRSVVAVAETPASTVPLATPVLAAAPAVLAPAPLLAARATLVSAAPALATPWSVAAPLAAPIAAPLAAPLATPLAAAIAAPALRSATLTTVVNNPGHAVSYRVD